MNLQFTVHGRIGRLSHFLRLSALIVTMMVAFLGVFLVSLVSSEPLTPVFAYALTWAIALAGNWFGACLAGKRTHDLGHSAWLVLLALVPVVNVGFVIWLTFWPGKPDANRFGEPSSG